MGKPVIWFTRHLEEHQAEEVSAAGFEVIVEPLIESIQREDAETEPQIIDALNAGPAAVAVTSRNGAESLIRFRTLLFGIPVFSVGAKTREYLAEHGIDSEMPGGVQNGAALANLIRQKITGKGSVIHLCSSRRRPELSENLKKTGLEYTEIISYDTNLIQPENYPECDVAAFFSPSAVESFFSRDTKQMPELFASVGMTTTSSLIDAGVDESRIVTAPEPSVYSVIQTLAVRYHGK